MKKIISLIATVAMMASMVVTASAAESKMTLTTTVTAIDSATYLSLVQAGGYSISSAPSNKDFYKIVIDASGFGTLNAYENEETYTTDGRRLTALAPKITLSDSTKYVPARSYLVESALVSDKATNSNMKNGVLAATYGGTSATAYPSAPGTEATEIKNAFVIVVPVTAGETITGTVSAVGQVTNFVNDEGTPEAQFGDAGTITFAPATITLGAAPVKDTSVTTDDTLTDGKGVVELTYGKDAENKTLEGKKVYFGNAKVADAATLTNTSRLFVTYNGTETKNYNIFAAVNAEGDGAMNSKSVAFGIIFTGDLDTSKFTFEIK